MGGYSEDLANIITPPEQGNSFRLTLSTTARSYDIRACTFNRSPPPDPTAVIGDRVMLRLEAETCDVFYQFADVSAVTLDKSYAQTEAVAEATAVDATNSTNAKKVGGKVPAGTFKDITIDRSRHKYLHVQGSAAGYLSVHPSSLVG